MNQLLNPIQGRTLLESDINPEYRELINKSRQAWTLEQILKVEEAVRPDIAADIRISVDQAKTEHARQILLNQHINIQERYFRRSELARRTMRKAMLEED